MTSEYHSSFQDVFVVILLFGLVPSLICEDICSTPGSTDVFVCFSSTRR